MAAIEPDEEELPSCSTFISHHTHPRTNPPNFKKIHAYQEHEGLLGGNELPPKLQLNRRCCCSVLIHVPISHRANHTEKSDRIKEFASQGFSLEPAIFSFHTDRDLCGFCPVSSNWRVLRMQQGDGRVVVNPSFAFLLDEQPPGDNWPPSYRDNP